MAVYGKFTNIVTYVKKLFLLAVLLMGSTGAWGQDLPEITTNTNDKKLYLIQTNQFQSFYMVPTSNGANVTTNNIPNDQMLWYFLDAGKDGACFRGCNGQ